MLLTHGAPTLFHTTSPQQQPTTIILHFRRRRYMPIDVVSPLLLILRCYALLSRQQYYGRYFTPRATCFAMPRR